MIWDTTGQEALFTLKFFNKILGVKMNFKHIVTMMRDKIFIHDLEGMAFV